MYRVEPPIHLIRKLRSAKNLHSSFQNSINTVIYFLKVHHWHVKISVENDVISAHYKPLRVSEVEAKSPNFQFPVNISFEKFRYWSSARYMW